MRLKKISCIFLLTILLFQTAKSTTWTTASNGYWNNSSIWSAGVVPPSSSSDTFLIKHKVILTGNVAFNSNAYVKIDSTGGVCGHYKFTFSTGSSFVKYGILELDTLSIPGGVVNFYPPGQVILSYYGFISNGGSLSSNGNALAVGPWFTCLPDFHNGIDQLSIDNSNVIIAPNPFSSEATITFDKEQKNTSIKIMDMFGKELRTLNFTGLQCSIEKEDLKTGIYFLQIIDEKKRVVNKKIIIQ